MIIYIDSKPYEVDALVAQHTFDTKPRGSVNTDAMDISFRISMDKVLLYKNDVIKLFDEGRKFHLSTDRFVSENTFIKMIQFLDDGIEISLFSDKINFSTYKEYRENRIDQILKKD